MSTDLTLVRGDTGVFTATFTDDATPPNPINDPGAIYRMTVKRYASDADPGLASVTAHQTSPGVAELTIPPSATADLVCPNGVLQLVYDVQVTETGGRVSTVASGNLYVMADVTQATP